MKQQQNIFHGDVLKLADQNDDFRRVLFTTERSQLVLMTIPPGEEIGEETHDGIDQILWFVKGLGQAVLNGEQFEVTAGSVVVVPAGTRHNFLNTATEEPLRLYTVYTPPEHKDGKVHRTKQEAEHDPDEQHEQ